nr:unnamed protein product [Callosobruchus analis]
MENILKKADLWIKFPSTNDEIRAQYLWQQVYTFPSVIGVLNCTHVRISKPAQFGDECINRKRFASINVQATCNTQEKFTSVQSPGSRHDSRIWKRSDICALTRHNTQRALPLADEGYGVEPWLTTPYRKRTIVNGLSDEATKQKQIIIHTKRSKCFFFYLLLRSICFCLYFVLQANAPFLFMRPTVPRSLKLTKITASVS